VTADDRIVENEVALRRVNEAIEAGRRTRDGLIPFVCECGQLGCNAVIELELDEYERVRAFGDRFIVAHGHRSGVDEPITATERFEVVAKRDVAPAAYAERMNPRAEGID
jgi:hypothetical protein